MKSFVTIACLLLAAASHCSAGPIVESVDARVTCAAATFESVKALGLRLIDEYSEQLETLRTNYRACEALPAGGEREECHLTFGRRVVQVLLSLRPRLQDIKDEALRFTLEQLDEYFTCRQNARSFLMAISENTPSFCAVQSYEAARRALAPFFDAIQPNVDYLRSSVERCYYSPEEQKASCYYNVLLSVRAEVAGFIAHLERRRPVLLLGAINLLDGYFVCRSNN